MGKEREELEKIFEIANDSFLRNNRRLILFMVLMDVEKLQLVIF